MFVQPSGLLTEKIYPIQRVVSVFDRRSSAYVTMFPLRNFNLDYYRHAFEVPYCDPLMYEFYEITPEHLGVLRHETIDFDFERYIYYIECARCHAE